MDSELGIFIFIVIASVVSSACYLVVGNYILAFFTSSIATSIIFQIVAFIMNGYIEPFIIIALIVGTMLASVISGAIGFVFWKMRKK